MDVTLSLIFRRLATKFSNLVQKKILPGPVTTALVMYRYAHEKNKGLPQI